MIHDLCYKPLFTRPASFGSAVTVDNWIAPVSS